MHEKKPICKLRIMQTLSLISLLFAQADQGIRYPLTGELMNSVVYAIEQRMSRSDYKDAHAHLDLRDLYLA